VSHPKRMLGWMTLFVGAIGVACALLYAPLAAAFQANMVFNGLILAVFAAGVAINFMQVGALGPATAWVDQTQRGFETPEPPRLVAALARVVRGREAGGFTMSTLAMRSLLDGVRMRLDESRDVSRYLVGLLVFLGLLGTFWGLLETVGGVSRVIGGLGGNGDAAAGFAELQAGLEQPLAGMGTAFSSSLFGLAGALALGILDLQAGHAQNRFFTGLEEFLATRAHLPSRAHGAEGEQALPAYIEALLDSTAENLGLIQRMMTKSEEERRAAHDTHARLTERLSELTDQLRAEQKVIMTLSKNQLDLQPALAELAQRVTGALASQDEMRDHLRNVDVALGRLVEEVSGARGEVSEALRQEVRVLARSLGQSRARA
jgi:hypothetical protein